MKLSVILTFLILIPIAKPMEIDEYNVRFDITDDLSVMELLEIKLNEIKQPKSTYLIVGDFSDLSINNTIKELNYTVSKTEEGYRLNFTLPVGSKRLFITFLSKELIFSKDKVYNFFTIFRPPNASRISAIVCLPKGYVAYHNLVFPTNANRTTDGERICFSWLFTSGEGAISVSFHNPNQTEKLPFLAILALMGYAILHYRKKARKEFLKGFSTDERMVVEILISRRAAYQNKVEKELGFSRAKMARIVKKLENKGLIRKERVGRTNRIFWKG